jgi:shikimate dehydrogenase
VTGRPYAEVIGDPIAHSKSPLIHNFWLAKLGIDAEYRKTHVRADGLQAYLAQRRNDPLWRGCNVTMPHKTAVFHAIEDRDQLSSTLAAANTVARTSETGLRAYNTDVAGVSEPLTSIAPGAERFTSCVQIFGAGGAARAAVLGAKAAGYTDFAFYNRTEALAKEMARFAGVPEQFGASLASLGSQSATVLNAPAQGAIIINATSMGMLGQPPLPIDLSDCPPGTIVFDMVYAPLETPLLAAARLRGLRTIEGLQMLVAQAAAAFELFFGEPAPREHDAELHAVLTA